MKKLITGMFLGGMMGAGVSAAQAYQSDDPMDELSMKVGQSAAVGASVGAALGFMMDRRTKRRSRDIAALAAYAAGAKSEFKRMSRRARRKATRRMARAGKSNWMENARPRIDQALDIAADVRDAALPLIDAWAEQSRRREMKPQMEEEVTDGKVPSSWRSRLMKGDTRLQKVAS